MSTSLYRKYRPQTFAEISGQRHITTTLANELAQDRIAHAYLFTGPRGTGKTTTSRILAKAVNCANRRTGESEPCNACAACSAITAGNALDVLEIDAASHTGVDHVREHIISASRVTPTALKRKVYIIDEVHMLSLAAFNALLKTLEEPPAHVLFILATTEVGKLPATIVSRCQRFDFKRVPAVAIVERLSQLAAREGRQAGPEVLQVIAAHADGAVRDAESLLEQVLALGDESITLEHVRLVLPTADAAAVLGFLEALSSRAVGDALERISQLVADGVELQHFAADVTVWLRRALLYKSGVSLAEVGADLTVEQSEQLRAFVARCSLETLLGTMNVWMRRSLELKYTSIPQLPLELAVVELCAAEGQPATPLPPPVPPAKTAGGPVKKPKAKAATDAPATAATTSAAGAEAAAGSPPPVSLEQVLQAWPTVLNEMKAKNFGLFSLLRVNQPCEVAGETIRLGVAYQFHQVLLQEAKNRAVIEAVLSAVFGLPLRVGSVLRASAPPTYQAEDEALRSWLQDFGGKLVE